MSNTTAAAKVSFELENDLYAVTCGQHSLREVFDSPEAAERFGRQHEADVAHWYPTIAPTTGPDLDTPAGQAYADGYTCSKLSAAPRMPAFSSTVRELIEGMPVGTGAEAIMQAWLDGYDQATREYLIELAEEIGL